MTSTTHTLSPTHAGTLARADAHSATLSRSTRSSLARDASLVLGFAALTALCAQITLPLAATPVPITLQTLSVVGAGIVMSARLAALSMALYLALGVLGLPVFADAHAGLSSLLGVTAGYLFAFPLCQPIVRRVWTSARIRSPFARAAAASLAGHAVIFALGCAWLALWLRVGPREALFLGFLPFVPGTIIKTLTAAAAAGAAGRSR